MKNFLDDEYIDKALSELPKILSDEYYVKMGAAWLLAEAAVNYREKVDPLLDKIDPETAKYARQKMRDSFRVKS
ncbi:MAG: hypothetical protein LBB10_01240 [Bifidobacteriaceae bacterium]|jgi:3-methyladenine DNA glycosylase AlkD|nr:hypothetical protein [Bifidobacteriaceae bacterium]